MNIARRSLLELPRLDKAPRPMELPSCHLEGETLNSFEVHFARRDSSETYSPVEDIEEGCELKTNTGTPCIQSSRYTYKMALRYTQGRLNGTFYPGLGRFLFAI